MSPQTKPRRWPVPLAGRGSARSAFSARRRSEFPKPAADEFYWADLIGLGVVNREGLTLGSVVGLIDTGPHSVLRIQPAAADGEEVLIPFVSAYVDSVDLPARRIVVDWGLDY